ncbi:protein mono-ADP-ribosyltransferase PARP15-like [Sminthopsis crassicaudata]|uniref:protein mono-ADP-ribosyltransferase PARP15-like n=1 Tax=Sminthopsis crassicaudata TaxID=9301 RepID=UPI003D69C27B
MYKYFFETISRLECGIYESNIRCITFQVVSGDITKEESEVIVNSTDETFIFKQAVTEIFIVTQGENLRCKKIIHVDGGNDVKQTVSEVLQECEKMKYVSVSLPAIGTDSEDTEQKPLEFVSEI